MRGNNLFGIRVDAAWKVRPSTSPTHEVIKGTRITIIDNFRANPSWADSVCDRAQFFLRN